MGGVAILGIGGSPAFKKRTESSDTSSSDQNPFSNSNPLPNINLQKPLLPTKNEPIKKARVLHNYDPELEDELTLIQGEEITILNTEEDDGWWKGKNSKGAVGVFPSNFVEEILISLVDTAPQKPQIVSRTESTENKPLKPLPPKQVLPTNNPIPEEKPQFEKKKFVTPSTTKPPTQSNENDELLKKLERQQEKQIEKPQDQPPRPQIQDRPKPQEPPRVQEKPQKPEKIQDKPADIAPKPQDKPEFPPKVERPKPQDKPSLPPKNLVVQITENNPASDPSDEGFSPKLTHATKDRPKINSDRKKPQRRSSNIQDKNLFDPKEETKNEPPRPSRTSAISEVKSEHVSDSKTKPKHHHHEPQTLAELKTWMEHEMAQLKKELEVERTHRKQLEEKLRILEGKAK